MCSLRINDNGEEEKIQLIILLIRQAKLLNAPLTPSHWTKHFIALTRPPTLKRAVFQARRRSTLRSSGSLTSLQSDSGPAVAPQRAT